MGSLVKDEEFGNAIRKWLKPGDEAALARLQAALEECAESIRTGSGGFLTQTFISGVVETAAEMVGDAATVLAVAPKNGKGPVG